MSIYCKSYCKIKAETNNNHEKVNFLNEKNKKK